MDDGSEVLIFGPFHLSVVQRVLTRDGVPVEIGGRALDVLIALTQRAGKVVSVRELASLVWPNTFVDMANLRVQVAALRKVLSDGDDGQRFIVNVPGRGYTFVSSITRLAAHGAAVAGAAVNEAPMQAPPPLSNVLVGRDAVVHALADQVLEQRFVSIVGPGGIGKTSVALALAQRLRPEIGEDSICFVDLGSITDTSLVTEVLAAALGCFVDDPDPEPAIRALLASKRVLLIMDCCEHLINAVAPLVERLLHGVPSLLLIATSREAFRIDGEHLHLLTPLETPVSDTPSAAQALQSPAVQLFMQRAAVSGHRAVLDDAEAPIVASICRQLDGIALAIELVASRVGTYGIQGTFDLLEQGAAEMLRGRRNATPRHQTLQALFDWSFQLLSADEKMVLAHLSVFVGPFALEAAQAVAGATGIEARTVTGAVTSLADKSLLSVSVQEGATHFRLLDTTRLYAARQLSDNGDVDATRRRHAGYFLDLLRPEEAPDLSNGRNIGKYNHQIGNIRQALIWCFSQTGDVSTGIQLAMRAAPLFLGIPLFAECRSWCGRALLSMSDEQRGGRAELALRQALALSSMYLWDNSDEVRDAIERGLLLAMETAEDRYRHYLLVGLSVYHTRRGEAGAALDAAHDSALVADRAGGDAERAMSEWLLGACYHATGDQTLASQHCGTAAQLASIMPPHCLNFYGYDYNVRGLATYARILWMSGAQDQGLATALRAVDAVQRYTHPVLRCSVALDVIPVLCWSGAIDEASEQIERVVAYASKYALRFHHALAIGLEGELMARSDAERGVELLRRSLQAMGMSQLHTATLPTWRALAEGLASVGRTGEALSTIKEAVNRSERSGPSLWRPDLLRSYGEIILAQADPDVEAAERLFTASISLCREHANLSWELHACASLARLWQTQGRVTEARTMLEGVYDRFKEGFDAPSLVSARRLLGALS